jgi:penicillin-binding protein 2
VRVIRHVLPQAGKDLILTLDAKVQEVAEKELKATGHPGAAVLLNPQTGELLALASSPGFDPNQFMPLGDSDERKKLLSDPDLPLYNRTIQALYPPGSTFKIITSLAGLENATLDPAKKVYCSGSYTLGTRIFHCWKPHGHGWVDFQKGLSESCDVYFYQVGQDIGPVAIEEMAKHFGLGSPTGVDLPHEKKGDLPIAIKTRHGQHWQGGDTLNYAIGQGALQVTPLQMADLVSMVANGGELWQPYLVSESRRFGQLVEHLGQPRMVNHIVISEKSLSLVRDALLEAVRHGTGVAAQIPGIDVAGKTGTAQASKGKDQAWFVAYAPADKPQVACSVLVEHGGHGASAAAPIARDMIAMALKPAEAGKIEQHPAPEVQGD